MNWIKNIFSREKSRDVKEPAQVQVEVTPGPVFIPAIQIQTQSVTEWCMRLDKEAERTGNQRLHAQAANIRHRWNIS